MVTKEKNTKWLQLRNKALSGVLFLLGFGSFKEDNEMGEIVPMYGMPASVYKSKNKVKKQKEKEGFELEEFIHHFILKRKQDAR